MKQLLLSVMLASAWTAISAQLPFADPCVIAENGVYYAYGTTSGNDGVHGATSTNLVDWTLLPEPVLRKGDGVYGTDHFWAPEVHKVGGRYLLLYTSSEGEAPGYNGICVAESDSPRGPFRSRTGRPLIAESAIDNTLFVDGDGSARMFFVRYLDAPGIWSAPFDLATLTLDLAKARRVVSATESWEIPTDPKFPWRVCEAPYVVKEHGLYHLIYSTHPTERQEYNVCLATAPSIDGPWTKRGGRPVLASRDGLFGPGHGAFFKDFAGRWKFAFHAHHSSTLVSPREMYTADASFVTADDGSPWIEIGPPAPCAVNSVLAKTLVDEVDPMIGATTLTGDDGNSLGKTFPGATTPFGMVQLSPDTITGGDNGPGYSYHHPTIEGFSMTHMSGIGWYGDLGDFQVMPTTGPRILDREKAASPYSHSNEVAHVGYYSVLLDRYGIKVELRAQRETGYYTFTYPESKTSRIQIDLARRIGEIAKSKRFSHQELKIENDHEFSGALVCDHRDGGWGHGDGGVDYTLYYYARCSKPITTHGIEGAPTNTVFWFEFPTAKDEQVRLTVWISYESAAKAREYSRRRYRRRPDPWKQAFGVLDVEGGTKRERRIFATALYHAMLDPRRIDLPGQSRTVFSGWDVFRSEMPLLTLIRPDVVVDTINAMMGVMESGKRDTLPVWDLFGCPSGCMVGNPLIPVIATAQEAGLAGVDYAKALDLAVKTTRRRGNLDCGYAPDSLSETLEYCYDDWCIAEIAKRLGRGEIAAEFSGRAKWYTNVWDRSVGWMRTRERDGSWRPWKGETVHWQGTIESNPLQQGWFVPHDVDGLIRLAGGREKFAAKLEEFFEKAPKDFRWGDYYNHPNEPSHHAAFLFAEAGRQDLMWKWTRRILDKAYNDDVRGLCGNDDVGQMSAWYVLAAIGLNPMCPGDGRWFLTPPLFTKTTIRLDPQYYYPGKTFTILAPNASPDHTRIVGVRLNGQKLDKPWISTKDITSGGVLEFELAKE